MGNSIRRAVLPAALLLATLPACGGGGGGGGGTLVQGTAHLLNGSTAAGVTARALRGPQGLVATAAAPADGQYRITPERMTVTIAAVAFSNADDEIHGNKVRLEGCSATYDQTKASLASLADCTLSAPAGTWSRLTLFYGNTYQALFDDPAGFYSDPTSSTGLVSSAPVSGAGVIGVTDQNAGGEAVGQLTLYLPSSVTIDADHPPQVYVVFNPIHWMVTTVSGGTASAPRMAGNPPIIASVSSFGKAAYYTTVGTIGAYLMQGDSYGVVLLYLDASTPYLVTEVDGTSLARVEGYANAAVAFGGDTLEWGRFGRLGRDSDGILAWCPAYYDSTGTSPAVLGYRGVAEMAQVDSLGGVTTLTYQKTSAPPAPASGVDYSSGHPVFTADGSYVMTLLVN
jgi:hypothetical protein